MTDAAEDVAALEREAEAATALAEELEKRYIDGDEGVQPEQIAEQEKLGRWAKLKAERARRGAEKAKADARLAGLAALRAEVDGYATGIGSELADLLQAWFAAEDAFTAKANEHDGLLLAWRGRAEQLGAREVVGGSVTPPAADGHVALGRPGIEQLIVGSRRLSRVDPGAFMARLKQHSEPKLLVAHLRTIDGGDAA